MVFSVHQFQTFQQNSIDDLRADLEGIVDNMSDKRVGRLNTIANSIIGFYLGSQLVESEEFALFSKKILEENEDITNLFVIKDDFIIQSYPITEFQNKNIETTLPGYPVSIQGQKNMLLKYDIDNSLDFIIAVPFSYFSSPEILGHKPLKLAIVNSETSDILYQYDSENIDSNTYETIFSEFEFNEALKIKKQTNLVGLKIKDIHFLEYIIWTDDLSLKISHLEILTMIIGASFAITLFVLVFKTLILQGKLQEKSKQLEESNDELKNSMKLRNEFAAMISHELKTPLTPIKGYCSMLKTQKVGTLNDKQLDYLKEIDYNAKHLEELIEDLLIVRKLDMKKLTFDESEIQTRDLLNIIHETWKVIMSEKNIEFVISKGDNLCVKCDESRLRQVFANLIKNAVDFVPSEQGKIEIGATDDGEFVTFYVDDNGVGISEENQKKLFQKFYQVDTSATRHHGGTGLGLSICRGLIEGMNGTVGVKSKEGEGSRFFFKLPQIRNSDL